MSIRNFIIDAVKLLDRRALEQRCYDLEQRCKDLFEENERLHKEPVSPTELQRDCDILLTRVKNLKAALQMMLKSFEKEWTGPEQQAMMMACRAISEDRTRLEITTDTRKVP